MTTTLTIRALTIKINQRTLLRNYSRALKQGECLVVKGANGSGKTTLLKALAHRRHRAITTPYRYAPQRLFIGHQDALAPALSPAQNLRFRAQLWQLTNIPHRIAQTIKKHDLTATQHQPVHTLSAGQRQKVALASLTLTAQSKLWILDEPHSHLDATQKKWLNALMAHHLKQNGTLIIASHQPVTLPSSTTLTLMT